MRRRRECRVVSQMSWASVREAIDEVDDSAASQSHWCFFACWMLASHVVVSSTSASSSSFAWWCLERLLECRKCLRWWWLLVWRGRRGWERKRRVRVRINSRASLVNYSVCVRVSVSFSLSSSDIVSWIFSSVEPMARSAIIRGWFETQFKFHISTIKSDGSQEKNTCFSILRRFSLHSP